MTDEMFDAWFAGYYEGEGSITLAKRKNGTYLRLSIGSTDLDVLERVQERFGGGITRQRRENPRHKPFFRWQLTRTEEVRVIAERILPLLGSRRAHDVRSAFAAQSYASPRSPEDRFWALVDRRGDDDCWEWKGFVDGYGFGTWQYAHGRRSQAHRWAIRFIEGDVPSRVRSTCSSKSCVNPRHWTAAKAAA